MSSLDSLSPLKSTLGSCWIGSGTFRPFSLKHLANSRFSSYIFASSSGFSEDESDQRLYLLIQKSTSSLNCDSSYLLLLNWLIVDFKSCISKGVAMLYPISSFKQFAKTIG